MSSLSSDCSDRPASPAAPGLEQTLGLARKEALHRTLLCLAGALGAGALVSWTFLQVEFPELLSALSGAGFSLLVFALAMQSVVVDPLCLQSECAQSVNSTLRSQRRDLEQAAAQHGAELEQLRRQLNQEQTSRAATDRQAEALHSELVTTRTTAAAQEQALRRELEEAQNQLARASKPAAVEPAAPAAPAESPPEAVPSASHRASPLLDFNPAHDAVALCDANGAIRSWSRGAVELYGWSESDVIGKDCLQLLFCANDSGPSREILETVQETGSWTGEVNHLSKSGEVLPVQLMLKRTSRPGPEPGSFLLFARIRPKPTLPELGGDEGRADFVRSFATGMVSDLNAALAPILLATGLLRNPGTTAEEDEILTAIDGAADRAVELLKQILLYVSGTPGERSALSTSGLLQSVATIIREVSGSRIHVMCDFEDGLWDIQGERVQLMQALLKICREAAKPSASGDILEIRARNVVDPGEETDEPHNSSAQVLVTVKHSHLTTDAAGEASPSSGQAATIAGLPSFALAVAEAIIHTHSGTMKVLEREAGSVSVEIRIPALLRSTGALTTAPDENSPAANRHIVLVEEEVALRELMRQTLHGHGYLVSAAANEKALLDLISGASGKVGLVIMSLSVSWGDGPSIARLVRQWEPEVPILGLSSSSPGPESDWRLAVLEGLGIRRVLAKPFTGRALLQAVSQALAVRSTP